MRRSPLLLVALPGWVWSFLTPAPLSRPSQPAAVRPVDGRAPPPDSSRRGSSTTSSHATRCRPLFRKGFSKGGMGKQGELMEQMAKAQRDRMKRELEEKLRESGDLPEEDNDAAAAKPAAAKGAAARIKPDRSWRQAGATKPPSASAGGAPAAAGT
ncbi:unnamed protein product, partial [Ectocarpus fasciculatus]